MSTRVDEFERLRPHLLAVAYRLTGTFADAEDAVQEAWLRWSGLGARQDGIDDLRAWLTTVVSRIGLDRLKSAAHRRETYVGEWLPEPIVTSLVPGDDPLAAVVAHEDARFVAMVVLDRLSPDQRVAFVLHDGFAVPFGEIADVLGVTPAAARQLASRARRAVDGVVPARDATHDEVVGKLMAAMAVGDMAAVVALLHPDVTFTGDSNRKAPTAARVIHGPDKVARFIFGLAARYGPRFFEAGELVRVNGDLGMYTTGLVATAEWPEMAPHIQALTVREGLVTAIWDIANPDKFTASPLAPSSPRAPGTRPPS